MVSGVQCVVIFCSGIQWLLASYVSNLDSQNMVLQTIRSLYCDIFVSMILMCCILGSRPLILRHQLTDFRVHLTNIHCTGNEHRLIDCSHDYHSISQHNLCTGPAAVECQTSIHLVNRIMFMTCITTA